MPTYDPKDSKDVDVDETRGHGQKSDSRALFDALHDINGESSDEDDPGENEEEIDGAIVDYPLLTDLLPDLIFSILQKVMGKLVVEKLQGLSFISKGDKLNALYRSVLEIYQNEKQDYSARLAGMIGLIDGHGEVLPDRVSVLKSWLVLTSDVLLLKDVNAGRAMSANLQDILRRARTLLENPLFKAFQLDDHADKLIQMLQQCSLASRLFEKFRDMPHKAVFLDYFDLVKSDEFLGSIAPDSLLKLINFADQIRAKLAILEEGVLRSLPVFPDQGGYEEKLEWLVEVISNQRVQHALEPHIDSRLMVLFRTSAAFSHLFRSYPVEAGALKKLHWIASQTVASGETHPFKGTLLEPVLISLQQSIVGDNGILPAIEMLMTLTDPGASRFERMKTVLQSIFTAGNVVAAASYVVPWSSAVRSGFDLFKCYQTLPPDSSWEQTSAVLLKKITELVSDHSRQMLSGIGYSDTVARELKCVFDALTGIRKEWTWLQTVDWLLRKAKESPTGRWYYDRVLEFCLGWQLYQAAQGRDIKKVAEALNQARDAFGHYLPGISGTALDRIVSVLPLFPGLIALRREVTQLPKITSWITWLNCLIGLAGKSKDPSVRRLVEQINEFVEDVGTQALLAAFSSLSGAATILMQVSQTPATGVADIAANNPVRLDHHASVQALCEAGEHVAATLFSLTGAVLPAMFEGAMSRPRFGRHRYALWDPMALTDLLLPRFALGVVQGDLPFELGAAAVAARLSESNDQPIIWGDEYAKPEKILAGAVLIAYWAATSFAAFKLARNRWRRPANEQRYSAIAPYSIEMSELSHDVSGEGTSDDASALDRVEAERKLPTTADTMDVPSTSARIGQFVRDYRSEMAVGGAVLLGAGLTFYITKNFLMTAGPNLDFSEIVERTELVDVTESDDFARLFDNAKSIPGRVLLSADIPADAENNLNRYVSDLNAGLDRETLLKKFLEDLMSRLVPKIAKKKGLMLKMHDNFALLIELDQIICNMQNYVIEKEIREKNYTHFKALLLLNRARNYFLHVLIEKYPARTVDYYSVANRRLNFSTLEKFWNTELIRVCVACTLHEKGATLDEIETYSDLLRLIIESARLSATEYTEGGGVGLVDEGGLIKLIIAGVTDKLIYAMGRLIWVREAGAAVASSEMSEVGESTKKLKKLIEYLQEASKYLKGDVLDFIYPGDQQSRIRSRFITERCVEILGKSDSKKIIIPVTYTDHWSVEVAMFSLEQIILGVHYKHPYYKSSFGGGRIEITWPSFISGSKEKALLDITQETAWADRTLLNIDVARKHVEILRAAELEGIEAYTDNRIKEKAQELGIALEAKFDTKVSVTTEEQRVSRPGGTHDVKREYALGQIAFRKLTSRNNMRVSPPALTELVTYLHETDFQTPYQKKVDFAKSDAKFKSSFDAIALAKVQPYLDIGWSLKKMKYSGYALPGLFALNADGKFRVLSVIDNSIEIFDSIERFPRKFKADHKMRTWILKHSIDPAANWAYENGGYTSGAIVPISYSEDDHVSNTITFHDVGLSNLSFFDEFTKRLYNEADMLAKSQSEIAWRAVLDSLRIFVFFIQLLTAPLGALPAIAICGAAEGMVSIGKAIVADDPDEKNGYLLEIALCFGIEAAAEGLPYALRTFMDLVSSSTAYRRFMSMIVNIKFGKWLDEVGLGKVVRRGESSIPAELPRDLGNEVMVEKTPEIFAKINALERLTRLDPDVNGAQPGLMDGSSFDAAQRVSKLLQPNRDLPSIPGEKGHKLPPELSELCRDKEITIQYRSINAWSRLAPNSRVSHFAVVCEIDKVKYVIDPMPFEAGGRRTVKDAVLLEQEWVKKTQEGLTGVLVKYKDFPNLQEGRQYNRPDYLFDVDKTGPGTVLTNSPDWYEPDLLNYAGLNRTWRADVDLDGMTRDADGIYAADTEPDDMRYIKDIDGTVFRVKKDKDMNTWRVVNPANPTGYAPPVRRNISGRWVRHLDLAGKGGAPVEARQLPLDGARLKDTRAFVALGKERALEQLSSVKRLLDTPAMNEKVLKLAEVFWGDRWTDESRLPDFLTQMKDNIKALKLRVSNLDPVRHVNYYNVRVKTKPDGSQEVSEGTSAHLDTIKYNEFYYEKAKIKYLDAFEDPIGYIKSRKDLGAEYMGTVINHEMTHASDDFGTLTTQDYRRIGILRSDKQHDLTALARLALDNPAGAIQNADSFATFIRYLPHFEKNPQRYTDFLSDFGEWKAAQTPDKKIPLLFNFNVIKSPDLSVTMSRALRDSLRNMVWKRASDSEKIEKLIKYTMKLPEADELSHLAGKNILEYSIRNGIELGYDGLKKVKFTWGTTPEVDLERMRTRVSRDLKDYVDARLHLNSIIEKSPKLTRNSLDGETPETAAANWILKSSDSKSNDIDEITSVFAEFKNEDLSDPVIIGRIHERVYHPPAGTAYRNIRAGNNQTFMSMEIAESLFVKQLGKLVNIPDQIGDQLFGILIRSHPYADGNGRTARTLYAIARLRLNEPKFKALTTNDEDLLTGLPPKAGPKQPAPQPAPEPEPQPGPSGYVQEPALGSQRGANLKEYWLVEREEDFRIGYATLDEQAAHVTAWPAGGRPLDSSAQDLLVHTGVVTTVRRDLQRNRLSTRATKESGKKLIFYAPGTYRVFDADLVAAADRAALSLPPGTAGHASGLRSNEFVPMPAGNQSGSDGSVAPKFALVYSGGTQFDAARSTAISGISEYKISRYTRDYLNTEKVGLLAGSAVSGDRRADILSMVTESSQPTTLEEVFGKISKTGIAYKRVHLGTCRELDDSAILKPKSRKIREVASSVAGQNENKDKPVGENVKDLMISHLVTLITLDLADEMIEETVQGVIAKDTGEYIEIDAAAGDEISLPGYTQLNWGTPDYWAQLSDHIVDQGVAADSGIVPPQTRTTTPVAIPALIPVPIPAPIPAPIPLRNRVELTSRDGKFFYTSKSGRDFDSDLRSIYGSNFKSWKLALRSSKLEINSGKIYCDNSSKSVIVYPGAEIEFDNLYQVGKGETLNSIAISKLPGGWVHVLAHVNLDILGGMPGVIDGRDASEYVRLPHTIYARKYSDIPDGTIIRIPMRFESDFDVYKQHGDLSYDYLAENFYGYARENFKIKLDNWNAWNLLANGNKIESHRPDEAGKYIYFAPL